MSKNMWCNRRQWIVGMFPIVFVHYSAHYCAKTSSNNGFVSLCQHEKTTVSIYHRFDRSAFTMFKNIVQTIACFITHSDNAIPSRRLRCFNVLAPIFTPQKLLVNDNQPILKVQISLSQAAKFAYTNACFQ